ncbi:hypothetical protein [Mycolicibacterium sp. CR10]|uniref:hypothetical protein n=1 Tax=Mycolicibacterium sp. CR10 TaxID=2562314 RepID=UPI0010BFE8D0|nr:hypothetical protein [Mycolicibacterium sp. CR10]
MSLYDQSVELQLRLEATQSADSSLDLVAAADRFVDDMDGVSNYLSGTARFRLRLSITELPPLDAKAASGAISAFRAGLSRYGLKAVQQQPAAKLTSLARDQRTRSSRWATARWREVFEAHQPLLEEAQPGRLLGGSTHRYAAEGRAAKMALLQRQDPVADEAKVLAELCQGDASASWLERLHQLGDELARALQAVKDERDALTPEVQEALESASSEYGLSLADVSPALLEGLRAAGVDDDLVVRRR